MTVSMYIHRSDSKQGVVGEKKTATVSDTTRYYYYVGLIVIPSSYTDMYVSLYLVSKVALVSVMFSPLSEQ